MTSISPTNASLLSLDYASSAWDEPASEAPPLLEEASATEGLTFVEFPPEPLKLEYSKAGHSSLSRDLRPFIVKERREIRGDLTSDLANMSRRAARAASGVTHEAASPGLRLAPEHGPSLTVLTQRHHHWPILEGMQRVQEEIVTDPTGSKVVLDIDRIETEHPDKCYLYYAMSLKNFTSILFTSALFSAALDEGDKITERPPFIRLPEPVGPKTVQEFLRANPPDRTMGLYDHNPAIRKELVAVNPLLFSNVNNGGECTWDYYIEDANVVNRPPDEFFKMVFDRYGLVPDPQKRAAYIDELIILHNNLRQCAYDYLSAMRSKDTEDVDGLKFHSEEARIKNGSRAVIFQYEVSEDLVHQICYPAIAYGHQNVLFSSFTETVRNQCDEVFPDRSSQKEKRYLENDRLSLQGRMLAQSTMVPDHNIQTHTHGYGRFFGIPGTDTELAPSEPDAASDKPREWSLDECQRLARQANAAENSFECLELIVRKEMLLERAKRVFAAAIAESAAHPQKRV